MWLVLPKIIAKKRAEQYVGSIFFRGIRLVDLKHEQLFDQKHKTCEKVVSVNLNILVHRSVRF
jgi:hypothetical protein